MMFFSSKIETDEDGNVKNVFENKVGVWIVTIIKYLAQLATCPRNLAQAFPQRVQRLCCVLHATPLPTVYLLGIPLAPPPLRTALPRGAGV